MKKLLVGFLLVVSTSIFLIGCSSERESSFEDYDDNGDNDTSDVDSVTTDDENVTAEDPLSGIWDVVEGGDDHSIIIANGTIQLIDGPNNEIYEYTKPYDNVFRIELYDDTMEFKYDGGLLYRYINGEPDGYAYERTAYNSNKSS